MRVVVYTLYTHQSHWITCRENPNFWVFISKIPRPFWSGKEARHFKKTNFLYDFSMPWFQFWAGVSTLTQLLAGLALEPKITSHLQTLDTGGKLWLYFSKALCRSQGFRVPSCWPQVELFGTQERSVHIQCCQRGLTRPHQQTSNAPGPCCAAAHGHGVVGGISTPFIYESNVFWENRAAASLSLAGKTLVRFNVSYQKLLSSKQPIFGTRQSARRTVGFIFLSHSAHTVQHRETRRARGELGVFFGAPEQKQTLGWLIFW